MTARTDTRDRILAIADRHLMRRGYHAFSFADIAQELGIKPAAVHYHFPTKPELVIAVIQAYARRFEAWSASVADAPPADRLCGYFEIGRLVASDGRVCPPIEPTSALMTESVTFTSGPPWPLSPCWPRAPCRPSCTPPPLRARACGPS